jgi:hypothetical protein
MSHLSTGPSPSQPIERNGDLRARVLRCLFDCAEEVRIIHERYPQRPHALPQPRSEDAASKKPARPSAASNAVRKIALGLSASANQLLFEPEERGPSDDLRLQFEAASRLDDDERNALKSLIEGLLLKHEAKRWAA